MRLDYISMWASGLYLDKNGRNSVTLLNVENYGILGRVNTFSNKFTLNIAALSLDTFLTNIRTDVALQKSLRNTRNVSGSTSILTELIFLSFIVFQRVCIV